MNIHCGLQSMAHAHKNAHLNKRSCLIVKIISYLPGSSAVKTI